VTRWVEAADLPALVGQEMGVSDWLTVDQSTIDRFADLCGDRQWIHIDVERATREIGGPIAHGFLTVSLMSALAAQVFRIAGVASSLNYGFDKLRFTGTVPAGARIRLRQVLQAVESKGNGLLVTTRNTVEVEGHERPALVADWLALMRLG
jgi:acyl dehydratase